MDRERKKFTFVKPSEDNEEPLAESLIVEKKQNIAEPSTAPSTTDAVYTGWTGKNFRDAKCVTEKFGMLSYGCILSTFFDGKPVNAGGFKFSPVKYKADGSDRYVECNVKPLKMRQLSNGEYMPYTKNDDAVRIIGVVGKDVKSILVTSACKHGGHVSVFSKSLEAATEILDQMKKKIKESKFKMFNGSLFCYDTKDAKQVNTMRLHDYFCSEEQKLAMKRFVFSSKEPFCPASFCGSAESVKTIKKVIMEELGDSTFAYVSLERDINFKKLNGILNDMTYLKNPVLFINIFTYMPDGAIGILNKFLSLYRGSVRLVVLSSIGDYNYFGNNAMKFMLKEFYELSENERYTFVYRKFGDKDISMQAAQDMVSGVGGKRVTFSMVCNAIKQIQNSGISSIDEIKKDFTQLVRLFCEGI